MPENINQNPEQIVRDKIDKMLIDAGWVVQSKKKNMALKTIYMPIEFEMISFLEEMDDHYYTPNGYKNDDGQEVTPPAYFTNRLTGEKTPIERDSITKRMI